MSHRRKTLRKSSVLGTLAVFVFTGVFGLTILTAPQKALAQNTPSDAPANAAAAAGVAVQTGDQLKQSAWEVVKISLTNAAILAVLNAANYFAQKIAYDAANYIASGGKGQKPFFTTEGLGDYLGNVAKDAAGEAIGTLSKEGGFEKLGINLCAPTAPRIALNIQLGLLKDFAIKTRTAPTPSCSWRSISNNWDQFTNLDSDTVLSQVGVMFTPGQNELSAAIEVNRHTLNLIDEKQQAALNSYIAKSGFKDLVSKVSGKVLTPAETIKAEMNRANKEAAEGSKRTTEIYSAAAIGQGAYGILPAALQTFAGTLGEKLMKRIFEKGLIALTSGGTAAEDQTDFASGAGGGGRAAAELANASLLTPRIISSTNYDELTLFATCPAEGRQPDNCVMDGSFFNGVQRSKQDLPLTVQQAIDEGFLHGEWRLLPVSHQNNASKGCYQTAYCYSNLIKMRKARIIPIGWELAANSPFNDVSDPVTLQEAVNGFNNCPVDDDGNVDVDELPDPLHPWCRLIDPDWILKYPEAICTQQAPGPTLVNPLGDIRGQVCVDSQSCILEDENGRCIGGYGYCLAEKGFWRLSGESCPSQYATCQSLVRTADNQRVSYLMNTTQVDVCTADNAGCRQYSRTRNLIANGGFEGVVGGEPRGWFLGGASLSRSSAHSQTGSNALNIGFAPFPEMSVPSLIPGDRLEFSLSGLAEDLDLGSTDEATLLADITFRDVEGVQIDAPTGGFPGTCETAVGDVVRLELLTSDLGYQSAKCDVTVPENALTAVISLSTLSGRAYVDDVALMGEAYSFEPLDTIYFNGKIEECERGDVGCRKYIEASSAQLNLVRNPGFEAQNQAADAPLFWDVSGTDGYSSTGEHSLEGFSAIVLSPSPTTQEVAGVLPDASYVFSASSRYLDAGDPPSASALLTILDGDGNPTDRFSIGEGCARSGSSIEVALPTAGTYAFATCQFMTPDDASDIRISFTSSSGAERVAVDQVQLELGAEESLFHEGYSNTAQSVFLKAPPAGLNCTGADTDPEACDGFALSCRREEVGCDSYTPRAGGVSVPAITTQGDTCPTECVGYDTFRQEPTDFSDEEFPLFLIPSTANACSAVEAGCEEFTNLDLASGGGESREYYSSLRLCTPPNTDTATFYTWEGSDTEGFQLRVWQLMESGIDMAATGELGSDPTGGFAPCTNLEYNPLGQPQCADSLADDNLKACNSITASVEPDCREFYDVDGNIHYRYFSRTIVATNDCTEYRLTRTDEDECRGHGGLWTGAECHYFAVGSLSQSCRAEAAGCRAYTGNASRNIRNLLNDGFEDGTAGNWKEDPAIESSLAVSNSNEAVSAGGHSLRVTSPAAFKDVSNLLSNEGTYLLSFWAKGGGDLRVRFSHSGDEDFTFDRIGGGDSPVPITNEWRPYTVGPVTLTSFPATGSDPADREHLTFEYASSGPDLFLDNIILQEVSEAEYLISGSWQTPAACDQTPAGDPAPQFMLGCAAYTRSSGENANLKSFSRLCREEAIGCTALYDTQNSDSPFPQTFNATCTLDPASPDAVEVNGDFVCQPSVGVTCACELEGEAVCQVGRGASTCKFDTDLPIDENYVSDGGHISPDGDTVRVPADSIVYLINDPAHRCNSTSMGCTEVGLPTFNPEGDVVTEWETLTVLDRPEGYEDQLCRSYENFCQAYKRTVDGSSVFFKDPLNHTCEYKDAVAIQGFTFHGWFKKGTNEPCYEDFLVGGIEFDIYRNSDAEYDGWVGTCPAQYDQCKEFVDPLDTSQAHPEGQPYYAILNDQLDTATCQNQVSLTSAPREASGASACVLFDQTDNLQKRFDAQASYDRSDEQNGGLVSALGSDTNDTNIVIRVDRDRRCSEWLDCRSSETIFNATTGEFQNVCTAYAICGAFEQQGDATTCTDYVESSYSGEVLTPGLYQTRPVGNNGFDLSGYSIPGRYPVDEMITIDVSDDGEEPDFRLVHSIGNAGCTVYGAECGEENALGHTGTCLGPSDRMHCVYSVDGNQGYTGQGNLDVSVWDTRYPSATCRAFPQEDAPFPAKVADPTGWDFSAEPSNNGNPVFLSPSPAFQGANVCQRRYDENGNEYESCECSYQMARYGGDTKYFAIEDGNLPPGYCSGGIFDGYECDPRASGVRTNDNPTCCAIESTDDLFGSGCSEGGQCVRLSKVDRVVGYEGQCLERDLRTPINGIFNEFACATWRPVGIIGGSLDIYNLNQSAGYFVDPDQRFYCAGIQGPTSVDFEIPTNSDDKPFDLNGDGTIDFDDLPITQYFGPGTVNSRDGSPRSGGRDCEDAEHGAWCVYPGKSSAFFAAVNDGAGIPIRCLEDGEFKNGPCGSGNVCLNNTNSELHGYCVESSAPKYVIDEEALGILGCYEISDDGTASESWIDYPYIGPDLHKDNLKHIYFQVTDDIYSNKGGSSFESGEVNVKDVPRSNWITNPFQKVGDDCNDEGDDNIDVENDDRGDARWEHSDPTLDGRNRSKKGEPGQGLFYIREENDWEADPSDSQGTIILKGYFNSEGFLEKIRVAASDRNDEGAFGIIRMGFVFKDSCSKVARVDVENEFGLTKAFTDHVNQLANYSGNGPVIRRTADIEGDDQPETFTVESFETACSPWGAVNGITTEPSNNPWDIVSVHDRPEFQCTNRGALTAGPLDDPTFQDATFDFGFLSLSTGGNDIDDSLRYLFRFIEKAWSWAGFHDGSAMMKPVRQELYYTPLTDADNDVFLFDDRRELAEDADGPTVSTELDVELNADYHLPRVASVSSANCTGDGRCPAGSVGALNINGRETGSITSQDGVLKAVARFYGWASHNSMPILKRRIIWGGTASQEVASQGWYKNQKPYCASGSRPEDGVGECEGFPGLTCVQDSDCPGSADDRCRLDTVNHFGNTPGACQEGAFEFQYVYTCTSKDIERLRDEGRTCEDIDQDGFADNAPCVRDIDPDGPAGAAEPAPACIFRPGAQIQDNWEWCNCSGENCEVIGGAFGEACDISPENADPDAKPWTEFQGELRVFPDPDDVAGPGGFGGFLPDFQGADELSL